jgi:hypothetical protein
MERSPSIPVVRAAGPPPLSRQAARTSIEDRSTENFLEGEKAMKKQNQMKPLQLSRETLRQLDTEKLAGVGGGDFTETITTIFSEVVVCVTL